MHKNFFTKEQALQKLKHYCGYQERCHLEIKEKLYSLGVKKQDHDEILAKLIEENYLNEERFAIQFAGGKFRINHWGKRKISFALKEKQVSEYLIRKALKIDEKEYFKTLSKLAAKKYSSCKTESFLIRKKKTFDFLIQKGYEPELINQAIGALK
jgi:regulatory protein